MRERLESIITTDGWILCAKCGHKLARVVGGDKPTQHPAAIELKCQCCKTLNIYGGKKNESR